MTVLLDVKDLKVDFPIRSAILRQKIGDIHAVRDVSLTIDEGETLAIVGESGSGKTTMARAITRLVPASSGSILLDGQDLMTMNAAALRRVRRSIQVVFQNPYLSLNRRHKVGRIIAEPLRVHGIGTPDEQRRRVAELLERVGLSSDAADRYPSAFSGGQRQRIAIARALALKPRLVVCDEPVSALDISVQAQILNLLLELKRDLKLSYLFITHDLGVVRRIADRIAVMHAGKIVETAPPGTLFRAPSHPYTKALLSAMPQHEIDEPRRARIRLTGEPPSPLSSPPGCLFAGRCPEVQARCLAEEPDLRRLGNLHDAACHFAPAHEEQSAKPREVI